MERHSVGSRAAAQVLSTYCLMRPFLWESRKAVHYHSDFMPNLDEKPL
jgi:hypothetical protein